MTRRSRGLRREVEVMVGNQGNGGEAPVHHPTQEELAVEVWEDESPAPEPEEEHQSGDA